MTRKMRLSLVLALNLAMVAALIGAGLASHSLGVLAAAGDYLGDAAGVAMGLLALRLSARRQPRATAYVAFANGSLLLVVTLFVIAGAAHRLLAGAPRVQGLPVIGVSMLAAAVMAVCAWIIGTVEAGDLSMRSVMLDTLADGAAALGVATSGAIILVTGSLYWLDSAAALAIALVIGYHALKLLRDVLVALDRAGPRARRRAP